jgi:DNA-binding MarR family transcriptional regulator
MDLDVEVDQGVEGLEFALTPERITNLKRRLELRRSFSKGKLTKLDVAQVLRAFLDSDESVLSIAKRMGVTSNTITYHVSKHLKQYGINLTVLGRKAEI